jgi:hypothetical protein
MKYPVLIYKIKGKLKFFSFTEERLLKHTSRELLKNGIFNDLEIIDADGKKYVIYNIREVGWANAFFGISLTRKGIQIKIEFDVKQVDTIELDTIKEFVLSHIDRRREMFNEVQSLILNAKSIETVISCFF